MQQLRYLLVLFTLLLPATLWGQGRLEVPSPPQSVVSGIGYISGWFCNLPETDSITVRFDGGPPERILYGSRRNDTRTVCGGTTNNGFVRQMNWNLLGDGLHVVELFAGDVLFGSTEVTVATLGEEFLRNVTGSCEVEDFPRSGLRTTVSWQQASQNFAIDTVEDGPIGRFTGTWEGVTSQGLPILLTVNDADRISRLALTYQQPGEIPPDSNCRFEIIVDLSVPVGNDGTFSVSISVPEEANTVENTRLSQFEGILSGTFGESQGVGQWEFTQALLFCQRNPSQSVTRFCNNEDSSCADFDFSYDADRLE